MASTFLSLHYHVVFSTKDRRPLIHKDWRPRLCEYLGGIIGKLEGIPETIGGVEDRLRMLIGQKASHCLADIMREVKRDSSKWIRQNHEPDFAWQDGYAAFTVSVSNIASVRNYIRNQEVHHKRVSFKDELIKLLEKHQVAYDLRYLLG
jgi:REP element-mobilizing transposase RayT